MKTKIPILMPKKLAEILIEDIDYIYFENRYEKHDLDEYLYIVEDNINNRFSLSWSLGVSAWTCSKCGVQHNRNENSANNHRLAYKEILLSSINPKKGNDLIGNKTEQCLEKELKIKASSTLQDVGDLDIKLTTL